LQEVWEPLKQQQAAQAVAAGIAAGAQHEDADFSVDPTALVGPQQADLLACAEGVQHAPESPAWLLSLNTGTLPKVWKCSHAIP
jgi:hypothetical protein